jgi:hypothetical protein
MESISKSLNSEISLELFHNNPHFMTGYTNVCKGVLIG